MPFILLIFSVLFPLSSLAEDHSTHHRILQRAAASNVRTDQLQVNRITLPLTPLGGVYNDMEGRPGSYWNGVKDAYAFSNFIFDQGLWVMGKRNGALGWLPYLWWSPYSPGPVIGGRPALYAHPEDSSRYRAYGITYGDTPANNRDVVEWPSDLGAPVDAEGHPQISGNQTIWMVYNGLDTSRVIPTRPPSKPAPAVLPVEIHQTAFEHFGALNDTSVWANTVFMEWSIYNRSTDLLDSVYLSVWTDLDFILPSANVPAVDTLTQSAYMWYEIDSSYASIGYTLLYGPSIKSPGDTAIAFGKKLPGYRNLPLTAFWPIGDDSYPDSSALGPPYSFGTGWNVVRGLTQRGFPIIDSTTKLPTKFPYSGDPITGRGSIYRTWHSGGAGFMMTSGPCTLPPGDSVWMMIVINPCAKVGGVDAITRMRMNASYMRSLPYDSLVARKPYRFVQPDSVFRAGIPSSFALLQNFPNPLNGSTTIPFDLPVASPVQIEIFDILGRSVDILGGAVYEPGHWALHWTPMVTSGVYFYRLRAGSFTQTKRLLLMK
jgi:hypothetical protein